QRLLLLERFAGKGILRLEGHHFGDHSPIVLAAQGGNVDQFPGVGRQPGLARGHFGQRWYVWALAQLLADRTNNLQVCAGEEWGVAWQARGARFGEGVRRLVEQGRHLLAGPPELIVAEQHDTRDADHRERDRDEGKGSGDQLDPQRHPADCLPHHVPAAGGCGRGESGHAGQEEGSRSTYPTPRRVWISRGSALSTLRRSTDT